MKARTRGSLRGRLTARKSAAESAAKRLANSRAEMAAAKNYVYLVVNDDLETAVSGISCILTAEGLKVSRQDLVELAPVLAHVN